MPRIAMIGAGSVVFTLNLMTDILSQPDLHDITIALMDINSSRLSTSKVIVERLAAVLGVNATVEASMDRREAVRDADYVINAIQVGMHEATLKDFRIPAKYGLEQTIADTLGIGGIFRFLRTVPVFQGLLQDMELVCPNALLLNYTNPMAMLTLFAAKTSPIRTVGLCHSVQHTSRELAQLLKVPYEELTYRAAGINHVAFFLELAHKGRDLYPDLWRRLESADFYNDQDFRATHLGKVRFEAFRRLGYFVTESSEHFAEYTPYFIKHKDLVRSLDIPINEYIHRSENNLKAFEDIRAKVEEGVTKEFVIQLADRAREVNVEYAAHIIRSLELGEEWSFNGNVYNRGLISNLPQDSCVEVPCLVNRAGVQPTSVGALPPQLAALISTNINVQQLAVEAAIVGNRDYVYHAAMLDPNTAATLSLDEIWRMTDELFEAHAGLLPEMRPHRLK